MGELLLEEGSCSRYEQLNKPRLGTNVSDFIGESLLMQRWWSSKQVGSPDYGKITGSHAGGGGGEGDAVEVEHEVGEGG